MIEAIRIDDSLIGNQRLIIHSAVRSARAVHPTPAEVDMQAAGVHRSLRLLLGTIEPSPLATPGPQTSMGKCFRSIAGSRTAVSEADAGHTVKL